MFEKPFHPLAGLLVTTLIGSVFAERSPQFQIMQVDAMGRSGTASISGPSSMYLNPAGLAGLKGYGVQASVDAGGNSALLDYSNWANDNSSHFNSPDSLVKYLAPISNKFPSFSSTYFIQGNYQDFAFSVVRDVRYDMAIKTVVLLPMLSVGMLSDLQFAVGRGFTPAPDWNVGFAVKYLYRQKFSNKWLGSDDNQYYVVKDQWQAPGSSLLDSYRKISVASDIADVEHAFGVNVGTSYSLPHGFSVGAALLDFPTFFNGGYFYPQANVGGAYAMDFSLPKMEAMRYRLLVNLDWQFPFQVDPWFKQWKTGLSLEGRVHNHEVGSLSAGLNDGYPTVGVRAGYIVYAYYLYTAEETGDYPGQFKQTFHKFGLDMNF